MARLRRVGSCWSGRLGGTEGGPGGTHPGGRSSPPVPFADLTISLEGLPGPLQLLPDLRNPAQADRKPFGSGGRRLSGRQDLGHPAQRDRQALKPRANVKT